MSSKKRGGEATWGLGYLSKGCSEPLSRSLLLMVWWVEGPSKSQARRTRWPLFRPWLAKKPLLGLSSVVPSRALYPAQLLTVPVSSSYRSDP